jgi:ribulose-phosphate 3-epimerase
VSIIKIAPSILAADFTQLGAQIHACQEAGADWIHIDVMDGRFVPNISMGPLVVRATRRVTSLPLDIHLMIVEPERYVEDFASAGANGITVHVEASPHLHRTLQMIRQLGIRAGVALNPHTPISAIAEILPLVDIVTIMTVNPGFGGQSLIHAALHKFTQLREIAIQKSLTIDLVADGGVNTETAAEIVRAGASVLVAGTAVFNADHTVAQGIHSLRTAVDDAR